MNLHVIPNWLSLGLVAAYYAFALVTGVPGAEIAAHTTSGVVALVVLFAAAGTNILPGGVAKLLIAAFFWFGLDGGLTFVVLSMLPCGVAGGMAGRNMPFLPFAAAAVVIMVAAPRLLVMLAA